ncbi:MAG: hypothetical protein ACE5LL_08620, partial [Alphaproteobacteria bacterium]
KAGAEAAAKGYETILAMGKESVDAALETGTAAVTETTAQVANRALAPIDARMSEILEGSAKRAQG